MEDFLGVPFNSLSPLSIGVMAEMEPSKTLGIPIRDIVILRFAGVPAGHTLGPVVSELQICAEEAPRLSSCDYDCDAQLMGLTHSPPQMVWKMLKGLVPLLNWRNIPIALKTPQ